MLVREREIDELPFPICPCSTERLDGRGKIHRFFWHVRACQMRMRDRRRGAMRNRSETSQVVQAGFELERIAVAEKRLWLLLRISTVRAARQDSE